MIMIMMIIEMITLSVISNKDNRDDAGVDNDSDNINDADNDDYDNNNANRNHNVNNNDYHNFRNNN